MNRGNNDQELLEKLHQLIEKKKEMERISWDNLGDLIGYSGVGLKKALKIRSLSLTKLEEIIVKLGIVKDAELLGLKIENYNDYKLLEDSTNVKWLNSKGNILKGDKDLAKLESLCLSNWDSLMKRESFQDKVELTAMKDINKILDERLAVILKNLKQ